MIPRVRMARKRLGIARERVERLYQRYRRLSRKLNDPLYKHPSWLAVVEASRKDDQMQYRWPR